MWQRILGLMFGTALVILVVSACDYVGPHRGKPAHFQVIPLQPGLGGEQSRWVRLDTETGEQQLCTFFSDKVENDRDLSKLRCLVVGPDNDPLGIRGPPPATNQLPLNGVNAEMARQVSAELKLREAMRKCSLPRFNSKGWALMVDKNAKYAYVSSDKQHFEEVSCDQ